MSRRRPFGLGPIPDTLTGGRVVVRQAAALLTGALVAAALIGMAAAVLLEPGAAVTEGDAFSDRAAFGLFLVPAGYGVSRCLLRPRVVVDAAGVRLENAFSSAELGWPDVADARHSTVVEVIGVDGDAARTLLFGPAFAGPVTGHARPAELVALIRAETARRTGRTPPTRDADAAPLVAEVAEVDAERASPAAVAVAASIRRRRHLGLGEAAGYAAGWLAACALAAGLG